MLNNLAFAHALAILSAIFYMGIYLVGIVWREAFRFIFNAQFFGADVASLLPRQLSYAGFLGSLVTLVISAWVFAFAWAGLYNRLAR